MKLFLQVALCGLLAAGIGLAQRGGGGGARMGGGGVGSFGGFPGFVGGPVRVGFNQPVTGVPIFSNGVGLANTNVSFPFGLGPSASPLGFGNGLVFSNGRFFPSFVFPNNLTFPNNAFFNLENQRFGNEFWGGLGWGWGGGWGVGAVAQVDPLALPARSGGAGMAYAAPAAVAALPPEKAHPVSHEYDQSGKEVQAASTASSGERTRLVIHEYDADGKEIAAAR
jgi:hypothetical protein